MDAPFHASGDGVTDDTSAFQAALNAAGAGGGGIVLAPTGSYHISGTLTIPAHTTLKGTSLYTFRDYGTATKQVGTTLLAFAGKGNEGGSIYYPRWE